MQAAGGGFFCPRCEKRVYFAEDVLAMGKHWHKSCFLCANGQCRRRLDSRTCADHDGEAYCTTCHRRQFGPKGYGFGVGAGSLSMDAAVGGGDVPNGNASERSGWAFARAQVAPLVDSNGQMSPTLKTPPLPGTPDACGRCGKTVYLAERMIGGGGVWHKLTCFTCAECRRRLESTNLCEKDGEIFCKTCYGRSYGPKGYGFGVGAGVLQMQQ